MEDCAPQPVPELQRAHAAFGRDQVAFALPELLEQLFPDGHGEVVAEPPTLHPESSRDSTTRARLDGAHAVRRAFEEPHRRCPRGQSAVVTGDVEPNDARDI